MSFKSLYLRGCGVTILLSATLASAAPPASIPEAMEAFIERGQISGAVALVARNGEIVHHSAAGWADIERRTPMAPDSMFAVASMTKPIAAAAIMILKDEGKVSLDDPVGKYLPEMNELRLDGAPPKTAVTVRHLLTHTSGIIGSQQTLESLDQTVKELSSRPLAFEPGSKWQYSPGLNVCGRIVETVAQTSFAEFVQERIFEPLEMADSTFLPKGEQVKRLAALYKPGENEGTLEATTHWLRDYDSGAAPNPSGGLFSTAEDMLAFLQMILDGGVWKGKRILSEASVREMTSLQTGDLTTGFTPGNGWGLGFCIVRQPQGVTAMLSPGSFGHGGAFGTQGWVDPEKRMVFILMIQRTQFGNSDAADIRLQFQDIAVRQFGQ